MSPAEEIPLNKITSVAWNADFVDLEQNVVGTEISEEDRQKIYIIFKWFVVSARFFEDYFWNDSYLEKKWQIDEFALW